MDYGKLAADILRLVGGPGNVAGVTNCMTRLRFSLKEPAKADAASIEALKGVQGVVAGDGQFQVVIGTDVSSVCDEVKALLGTDGAGPVDSDASEPGKQSNPVTAFFGTLTAIFQPIIPALAGSGMIKALLALLVAGNLVDKTSQTYQIFNALGDSLFYFLPFILAVSSAKRFKCSPYVAAVLAGVLLHPSFTGLNTGDPVTLFGILPVTMVSYASSVIPILLIVWVQSKIEPIADKYSPKALKVFLAPMVTIILTGIIAIVIAGPLGNIVGQVIAVGFNWLNEYAGWLIPVIMGTFCPFFVMTGMHYCFAPIQTIQYATLGYGTILGPGMLASNIAQGAASLVVGLRSKNVEMKELGISSGVTALMGITEPALYGVTMRLKRPLYATMIGGGVAGLYAGITGIHTYSSTTAGIFALPVYLGGDSLANVTNAAITIAISFVVTVVATLLIGFDDPKEQGATTTAGEKGAGTTAGEKGAGTTPVAEGQGTAPVSDESPREPLRETRAVAHQPGDVISIPSPVEGEAIKLSDVSDPVFSKGTLGAGAAVIPASDEVRAPVAGTVEAVFPTGHAVGLRTDEGVELLIHVGLDTVELEGKHFAPHVTAGQRVEAGDLLVTFDREAVKAAGYDTVTPVIVSNTSDYAEVRVNVGEPGCRPLIEVVTR